LLRFRHIALAPLAAALGIAIALVIAAPHPAGARTAQHPGRLAVGVEVLHFDAAGRQLTGRGIVTARLTDDRGHVSVVHARVALIARAARSGGCLVLHLYLQQLTLQLLGLNAHLDRVDLNITGNPRGGVLGSLFCRLARARVASVRAADVRALNRRLREHTGRETVHFTAELTPQSTTSHAANATCPVLDLVVGPLNLQLLGLVVDLDQVHLTVTATRGQGVLGDLFCQLADNSSTSTSTGTTTTTGTGTTTTTGTGTTTTGATTTGATTTTTTTGTTT
jgi:hypothetical protein